MFFCCVRECVGVMILTKEQIIIIAFLKIEFLIWRISIGMVDGLCVWVEVWEKLGIITHPSQNTLLNKKIRTSIQMQTWEQISSLTFPPIQITHPPYLYYLHN